MHNISSQVMRYKELLYKIFVAFSIDGKLLLSQKRCTLIVKNKPLNYIALLLGQFFFQVSITGHSRQLSRNKFVHLELIANLEKNDFNFSETRDSLSVNALLNQYFLLFSVLVNWAHNMAKKNEIGRSVGSFYS